MKNLLIFLFIIPLCIACNNDDDTTTPPEEVEVSILGTWKLIAIRFIGDVDPPPDDEVFFEEVESNNTVTFYPNNIITSNTRILCSGVSSNDSNPTSGTYSLIDSIYKSDDCVNPDYNYPFIKTDSILIIDFPTNGTLQCKFQKIADLE